MSLWDFLDKNNTALMLPIPNRSELSLKIRLLHPTVDI